VIPFFGGIIANEISAQINKLTNTFYPPKKEISFNVNLNKNDGLLIKHISDVENITYSAAEKKVEGFVKNLKATLNKNKQFDLEKIGKFYLEKKGEIVFIPSNTEPFLTSSFGLSPFVLQKTNSRSGSKKGKETAQRGFLKYAAVLLIFFTTTIFFTQTNVGGHLSELKFSFFNSKPGLYTYTKDSQAKSTYSLIDDYSQERKSLDLIKDSSTRYYIIIGSFSSKKNAEKLLFNFKTKKETTVLATKNGLYRVSYKSYKEKGSALQDLINIKSTIEENAWILTHTES